MLTFTRPSANSTFHYLSFCPVLLIYTSWKHQQTFRLYNGLKLITRIRLGLSHLLFHKFKNTFQDTLNPICNCRTVETTIPYILHRPSFTNEILTIFNKIRSIDENILSKDESIISKVSQSLFLFGDESLKWISQYIWLNRGSGMI